VPRWMPDLVDLTPAEFRRLPAVGPHRHPAPDDHAVSWSRWRHHHPGDAGTRSRDGPGKTVPPMPNSRCTPHRQVVDQERCRSPAGVPPVVCQTGQ
jgi:hypothetical protein